MLRLLRIYGAFGSTAGGDLGYMVKCGERGEGGVKALMGEASRKGRGDYLWRMKAKEPLNSPIVSQTYSHGLQ